MEYFIIYISITSKNKEYKSKYRSTQNAAIAVKPFV